MYMMDYNGVIRMIRKKMTIIYYYKAGVLRSSTGTLELSKQNQLGLELFVKKQECSSQKMNSCRFAGVTKVL